MKQKIFLILAILLLSFFGVSIYNEFMANHTYYQSMMANRTNRKLIIMAIISVAIPLIYIVRGKIFSVKKFFVYIMPFALLIFTTAFVIIKDSIIGGSTGWIILMINTLLIYFLGMYAILGLTAF
jgi:cell division protein FtsW (lipid II flippase)